MDKVKLHAQERLDLDDTRSLQSLVYEYVSEALGGLMGHAHGVISVPYVNTVENGGAPYLQVYPFTFMTSAPIILGSTGADIGRNLPSIVFGAFQKEYTQFRSIVVNYDRLEEAVPHIDIDSLRENFNTIVATHGAQYLWARPIPTDTDVATRRQWDVTSGAETTISVATRESQRVAFVIQNGEPAWDYTLGEARWAKLAQITGFTNGDVAGSVPTLTWFSVFDDPLIEETLEIEETPDTSSPITSMQGLLALRDNTAFDHTNRSYRTFALPLLLTELRRQIHHIKGYQQNRTWDDTLPSGASVVDNRVGLIVAEQRITALENVQTASIQCIASCRLAVHRYGDTQTQYFGVEYIDAFRATSPVAHGVDITFNPTTPASSGQNVNRANIKIKDSVLAQGWAITHVSVTQNTFFDLDSSHRDYNRVTFLVHPNVYTKDSTDTDTMRLYDNTATNRGVIVEFLPHVVYAENHAHTEDDIHPPTGASGEDATTILTNLVSPSDGINGSAYTPYDLIFSVAVFAVPTANLDN